MTLDEVRKIIEVVSHSEKAQLFSENTTFSESSINLEESRFSDGVFCPHCGTLEHVQKYGTQAGKQRYRCKSCHKFFVATSKSVMHNTHKDTSTWMKYLKCIHDGFSLRKTAKECSISIRTAFMWRHKILDAVSSIHEKTTTLKGVIESDETYFRVSYKGSRHLPKGYKARRNGQKSSKRGLSKELVCVPCALDRHHNVISKACNLGKTSTKALKKFFENMVEKNSIFVTDSELSYRKFASQNNFKLIQIESGKHKNGIYHINNINAYHSNLKNFVYKFRGMSTKYLNNYLTWHNIRKMSVTELMNTMMSAVYSLTNTTLPTRKAIPVL